MPRTTRVELKGDKELIAKLLSLGDKLADTLEKSTHKAADLITKEAQTNAPIRRGILRSDIAADTTEKTRTRVTVAVGTDADAFYAPFVELGTVKHPPHPFLRPATDAMEEQVVATFIADIRKVLETAKE